MDTWQRSGATNTVACKATQDRKASKKDNFAPNS